MPRGPIKRWTLRELLNGSERFSREAIDRFHKEVLPTMRELARNLNRRRVDERMLEYGTRELLHITDGLADQLNRLDEMYHAIDKQAKHQVEREA